MTPKPLQRAPTYPGKQTPAQGSKAIPSVLPPPVDLAAPHEVEVENSEVIDDPEARREVRRKRSTEDRVERVEDRVDKLTETTSKSISDLTGTVSTLAGSVDGLKTVVELALTRDQKMFDAGLEVKTAGALDKIKGRATWRHAIARVAGTGAVGAGVLKLAAVVAHWLGVSL